MMVVTEGAGVDGIQVVGSGLAQALPRISCERACAHLRKDNRTRALLTCWEIVQLESVHLKQL